MSDTELVDAVAKEVMDVMHNATLWKRWSDNVW